MAAEAKTGNGKAPSEAASSGAQEIPPTSESDDRDGLPSFDPTGRGPTAPAKARGKPSGGSGRATPQDTSATVAPDKGGAEHSAEKVSGPHRKLDWHAVRSAAGPQLKAFLMPARESVDGEEVVIRYSETHKFHYTELKKRESELASLIEEVAGPGYRLSIEGPGGESAKKS